MPDEVEISPYDPAQVQEFLVRLAASFLRTWLIVPGSLGFVAAAGIYSGAASLESQAGSLTLIILSMTAGIMIASLLSSFVASVPGPETVDSEG